MTVQISPDPAHPYNSPAPTNIRRNMVYALGDVGVGNGESWTYYNPNMGGSDSPAGTQYAVPWSRPAIVISTAPYVTKYPEDVVKKWNPQMKGNLALLVQKGMLRCYITSLAAYATPTQILTFV